MWLFLSPFVLIFLILFGLIIYSYIDNLSLEKRNRPTFFRLCVLFFTCFKYEIRRVMVGLIIYISVVGIAYYGYSVGYNHSQSQMEVDHGTK